MKFRILRFKKLRSTNDTAIRVIRSSNLKYGMIIAESQNNGRGQYGRKWISLKGNLFVSFFYNLENMNLTITKITKLNCILVKKLISKYYKKRIVYKKPNDIEKKALENLASKIEKINENMPPEEIQTIVYTVGKENGYEKNLREWFKLIYQVLFGDLDGPRMGFFISFFGVQETIKLIKDKIN